MKFLFKLALGALLLLSALQTFGQNTSLSNIQLVKNYTFYKNPDPGLNHLNYFDARSSEMHLSARSKMVLTAEISDKAGYRHFKYQQFHEGLPVFGNRYILHEKDGRVMSATGLYSPQISVSALPAIDAHTALSLAKMAMSARTYKTAAPELKLCYVDPAFPEVSETLRLAYQVDLQSTDPAGKNRYFIDARSGNVIHQFPLIVEEGVPSKAKTRYYGVQNIITDSLAAQEFVLRDPTRGEGIFVYNNSDGATFTNTSSNWDLTNSDKDEIALDAHFCTQEYYDMMLADYNWQGQDGIGKALKVQVHAGDFANAFWDGEFTIYGDGDCSYGPLTTLEVVGHEFTHGMIDYTSNLVYSGESGAMNESLADMFGKLLERKTDPAHFSWDLGHSFLLSPTSMPFRVMDDPKSVQMPALYKGEFWEEFNDVHTNSAIGNLWFSMLVDGKQGTNEIGVAFNVPALGPDKVGQIIFNVNRNYLTENSNYNAFYSYSVEVAESIYGAGSMEVQAVKEAWKAVGLPTSVLPINFDLSISGDQTFDLNFCQLNTLLPVTFTITNTSGIAYNPATMGTASVTLTDFTLGDHTVQLTSPIGAGETFELQVNDWFQASEPGFTVVTAILNITDDNPDNNIGNSYVNITGFESDDLTLYVQVSPAACFANTRILGMYITNNSCTTIPAGTLLSFDATEDTGNPFWTSAPIPLAADLAPFGSTFIDFEIPAWSNPLIFTLIAPNDPDLSNNVYFDFSEPVPNAITGNYLNTFELNEGQDNYLEIQTSFSPSTMLYLGSHHFGSSGQVQNPDEFQRCGDVFNVFDLEYASGLNATIHSCVDFSFSPAPVLEFDLTLFRNQYVDPNFKYSSMVQAKWQGNQDGQQIIFDDPEGMVKHHTIPLPANFKGTLDFKFYTEIGHGSLFPNNLDEDDFALLDNLKLSAPTSGTEDLRKDFPVSITPNPARETTSIQASETIQTIVLQHVNGQTLRSIPVNASTFNLDLKELKNGFYLLNIRLDNGQWCVKKLVKMD